MVYRIQFGGQEPGTDEEVLDVCCHFSSTRFTRPLTSIYNLVLHIQVQRHFPACKEKRCKWSVAYHATPCLALIRPIGENANPVFQYLKSQHSGDISVRLSRLS